MTRGVLIGGDDFDLARQQFEVIKAPLFSMAILIRHALKSFGLDQYGLALHSRICFHFRKLALLIHTLSVTLKESLDSPYFAISSPPCAPFFRFPRRQSGLDRRLKGP